jgi:hypothetical protein
MACQKCGYIDKKEKKIFNFTLCEICANFAPKNLEKLNDYVKEKIDWKKIDSFRKKGLMPKERQKQGMEEKASCGKVVSRAPLGYTIINSELIQNTDSTKVHSLFKEFLNKNYSLNILSKKYGLSINGLKKVLKNRTYLGEIKFDKKLHKSTHKPIISPEIFYATQRKLENYLKIRKYEPNKYNVLKGEKQPLKTQEESTNNKKEEIPNINNNENKKESKISQFNKNNNQENSLYKSVFD